MTRPLAASLTVRYYGWVPRGETVEQVRALAQALGLSERTVYRRFKAMRATEDRDLELLAHDAERRLDPRCKRDGKRLPPGSDIRREHCNDACRQAAFRERRRRAQA